MSVAAKIYNWLILWHNRPHIDPQLWTNQNGFHQGRYTVSQILSLHHVIEEVEEHKPIYHTYFCRVQESLEYISRDKMFGMLLAYGITSQIIEGNKGLYFDTVAEVVSKNGNTNFFPIFAGVQQGDTLAPYLFITILDYIMRMAMAKDDNFGITLQWQRGTHCLAVHLTDTDFADNIALVCHTMN